MTTSIVVNDGTWHSVRIETDKRVLNVFVDEIKVGYDVEFESAHSFFDQNIKKISIGKNNENRGFRGCLTNLTLNNELLTTSSSFKLRPGSFLNNNGCDVDVLRVSEQSTAVDVGIALVIGFFVTIIVCFGCTFFAFKFRKWLHKKAVIVQKPAGVTSYTNEGADLNNVTSSPMRRRGGVGGNEQMIMTNKPPDLIGIDDESRYKNPDPMAVYSRNNPEHYDLDNASSIAPSDIDVAFHYKAYRSGGRLGGNGG